VGPEKHKEVEALFLECKKAVDEAIHQMDEKVSQKTTHVECPFCPSFSVRVCSLICSFLPWFPCLYLSFFLLNSLLLRHWNSYLLLAVKISISTYSYPFTWEILGAYCSPLLWHNNYLFSFTLSSRPLLPTDEGLEFPQHHRRVQHDGDHQEARASRRSRELTKKKRPKGGPIISECPVACVLGLEVQLLLHPAIKFLAMPAPRS